MKAVLVDPEDHRMENLKKIFPEVFVGNLFKKEEFLSFLGISEQEAVEEEIQDEAEEVQQDSIWLVPWIQRRINQNRNANLVFVGDTGSGKSYSSISLAEKIDPGFSAERIVFTTLDFLKLVNSNLPAGSVVIFDDAGLGIPAREWQATSAKIFGKLFQGFRYKNIVSMITVPNITFIERQSRMLMHLYLEATDTQGIMKPFRPFFPYRGDDRLGFRYPKDVKKFLFFEKIPYKRLWIDLLQLLHPLIFRINQDCLHFLPPPILSLKLNSSGTSMFFS